MAHLRALFP